MNVRMRITTLLLVLSVVTGGAPGVLAQSEETVKVEAQVSHPPCAIAGVAVSDGSSFGRYQWDHDRWTIIFWTGGDLQTFVWFDNWFWGCDTTVVFEGLVGPDGTTIGPEHFAVVADYGYPPTNGPCCTPEPSTGWTHEVSADAFAFWYTLVSIPDNIPGGLYTGVIEVSVVNSA